jgi:hypothetical protein
MEANLSQMKPKLSAERQPVGWHLPFLWQRQPSTDVKMPERK